jgi:hypothetical protein
MLRIGVLDKDGGRRPPTPPPQSRGEGEVPPYRVRVTVSWPVPLLFL